MSTATDTIDLADVVRTLRRGWRAVIGFTLLGALGAAGVILFAPRKYTGNASIVLKTGGDAGSSLLSRLGGAADAAGGLLSSGLKSPLETELQILDSRAVVGHAVDSLGLQARITSPRGLPASRVVSAMALQPAFRMKKYHFARVESGPQYRFDGSDTSGTTTLDKPVHLPVGDVTFKADAPAAFDIELRDREDAITRVSKYLTVGKAGGEVAGLTYKGDDSLSAAAVPNAITAIYLARRTTTDRGVNQHRVEFLAAKTDSAAAELVAAERALRRQQESSGVIDPQVIGKLELERASTMRASLTDLQVEDGAIKQLMKQVADGTIRPRELAAYPTFLKGAGINQLLANLSSVETERDKLLETRTEQDPEVIALNTSAKNIEGQLLPIARTYSAAIGKQRSDFERQLDSLQQKIAILPATAESGLRLQREVKQKAEVYGGLQVQLVAARLAAIAEGGDVRALDTAVPPKKPSFPDPMMTAGLGVSGGLTCGLLAALLLGMLGRWMQDASDVERITGVPAFRLDTGSPLLIGGMASPTVLVLPLDSRARAEPVAQQIAQTALARSLSATVLDLSSLNGAAQHALPSMSGQLATAQTMDVNASIERLEQEYSMVVVQLPGIGSTVTAAALRSNRPVVLVAPAQRIDRAALMGVVQTLRRLDIPCAGIVLSGTERNRVLAS